MKSSTPPPDSCSRAVTPIWRADAARTCSRRASWAWATSSCCAASGSLSGRNGSDAERAHLLANDPRRRDGPERIADVERSSQRQLVRRIEQRERRVVGAAQRIEQFGCAAMVSGELQPVGLGQFALTRPG